VVGLLLLAPTSGNLPIITAPITVDARQGASLTVPAIENVNGNNSWPKASLCLLIKVLYQREDAFIDLLHCVKQGIIRLVAIVQNAFVGIPVRWVGSVMLALFLALVGIAMALYLTVA
jgi:hypothetical protein